MNDDDKIDVAIRPVLPSRAAGPLPPLEIRRIDRNRKKNMKKVEAKAVRMHAAAKPKNPNRPLELKNQLQAVLDICAKLSHEELGGFRTGMEVMLNLSKPGRKRVLDALAKVYG